jgi:hypothetical protein
MHGGTDICSCGTERSDERISSLLSTVPRLTSEKGSCCNFVLKIKYIYHPPMVPKTIHGPASNRMATRRSKSVKGSTRTYGSDCSRRGFLGRFAKAVWNRVWEGLPCVACTPLTFGFVQPIDTIMRQQAYSRTPHRAAVDGELVMDDLPDHARC